VTYDATIKERNVNMNLIRKLKEFFRLPNTICNRGDCYQGRNCKCGTISFADAIIEVHSLASSISDADLSFELRKVADRLAVLGNRYHDRYGTEKNS
jgi:hypothetical protein